MSNFEHLQIIYIITASIINTSAACRHKANDLLDREDILINIFFRCTYTIWHTYTFMKRCVMLSRISQLTIRLL